MGRQITEEEAGKMLAAVKAESIRLKRCLSDKELLSIYQNL
jgi:hypothetical protein